MEADVKNLYDSYNFLFSVQRKKADASLNMSVNHYHNVYEIYYLVQGFRNYFIQDRTYSVEKGDIVLINVQDIHRTMDSKNSPHERILIYFHESFIADVAKEDINLIEFFTGDSKVLRLNVSEQVYVESILFKMLDEDEKKAMGYLTYERILLTELLLFINRYIKRNRNSNINTVSHVHKKMSEVAGYLMANYMKRITLKHVAEKFYITPCHLSRSFKKATGFSFIEYLNSLRIKEAQRLLKDTKNSVTKIAELTGFESQTHFGRVFRNLTGMSPLQFRKRSHV